MPARPRGVKVHYTGGRENPAMERDHSLCDNRARSVQNGHMDGNGWTDVGYSYLVCPHGKVFVGRGYGNLPAANGPGMNSGHYAVLGMVGNSGLTKPTDAMLHGIRDVIEYLRGRGVGTEIKGHRDGYATDCPGGPLYAWVRRGAPRPSTRPTPDVKPAPDQPAPSKPPVEDEEIMEYTSLGLSPASTDARKVPANTWTDVPFDTEWADPTKSHTDKGANPSFLNGPARYQAELEVMLEGLSATESVATRMVEVKGGSDPAELVEYTTPRGHTILADEDGRVTVAHSAIGAVQEGRKLRLQIRHTGAGNVKIYRAWARMMTQEA